MSEEFGFLNTLAESRMFPSITALHKLDAHEVAELSYLYLTALRILLCEDDTGSWARQYCRRTSVASGFQRWRTDGSDLYVMLHALVDEHTRFADSEHNHARLRLRASQVHHWLHDAAREEASESNTRRLFTGLDALFRVTGSALKAVRRLAQDWPRLHEHDRRQCMTRLIELIRVRGPTAEILPLLHRLARLRDLAPENMDEGDVVPRLDDRSGDMGLMRSLAIMDEHGSDDDRPMTSESASSGSTSSASVATVAGGLGAGFDPNGDHGVYQSARKGKKQSKSMVIRRGAAPK